MSFKANFGKVFITLSYLLKKEEEKLCYQNLELRATKLEGNKEKVSCFNTYARASETANVIVK